MANQEHLDILKQGVEVWNQWRQENPYLQPDLSHADLGSADLKNVNLNGAYLMGASLLDANLSRAKLRQSFLVLADLSGADLSEADLSSAILHHANLEGANLRKAELFRATFLGNHLEDTDLREAHLNGADLSGVCLDRADLSDADLSGANFTDAHLKEALFCRAILSGVNLNGADLIGANLSEAKIERTIFGDIDLQAVKGLETVVHLSPSSIGIDTAIRSHGRIPEIFLRQAGVPPSIIEQIPALIGSLNPIDFYSCFISYSTKDQDFAERFYADLQAKGVRCWFAPEDMKIGDKFWHRIDESIKLYDKLLVVLSQNSVDSEWVEREVMAALEKEKQQKKLVLFPIALDEAFKRTDAPWAADIRRSRHVGDFRNWKNHDEYQKAFSRLLRDLKSEAQKIALQDGTTNGGQI